jgi:hypothetical protein
MKMSITNKQGTTYSVVDATTNKSMQVFTINPKLFEKASMSQQGGSLKPPT